MVLIPQVLGLKKNIPKSALAQIDDQPLSSWVC